MKKLLVTVALLAMLGLASCNKPADEAPVAPENTPVEVQTEDVGANSEAPTVEVLTGTESTGTTTEVATGTEATGTETTTEASTGTDAIAQ